MSSFNKITIVGYLGRDPELKYMPDGTACCSLNVATTEKRKDVTGTAREITTWFRVTAWGRLAEVAHEHLAKGRQVYAEGRLRAEEYTDREGNRRTSLEVTAADIQFLSRKDNESAAADDWSGKEPDRKITPRLSRAAMVMQGADPADVPF